MLPDLMRERKLHEYGVLEQGVRSGHNREYGPSCEVFEAIQTVRDSIIDESSGFLQRMSYGLLGSKVSFPPYFIVLGYNPNDPDHQRYVSPNDSVLSGQMFSSLGLRTRRDLGNEGPILLGVDGTIVSVSPKIDLPGFNGNQHKNGIEASHYLGGTSVYTMEPNMGVINRYNGGKLVFSTSEEALGKIEKEMPLEDRRALIPGMESPSDVLLRIGFSPSEYDRLEFIAALA